MIASHMLQDVRKVVEWHLEMMGGRYIVIPTIQSLNNVMRSGKGSFLKENPCISQMNKLQFTKHVFQAIHAHQMEELHSAIADLSDNYVLADHKSYLKVPADVWFEWTPQMREEYVSGVQKLSLKDVFNQKDVPWPTLEVSEGEDVREFRPMDKDIVRELVNSHEYSTENADALKKEVIRLLNHPNAIQRKASLQTSGVQQFASESCNFSIKSCLH